MDAQPNWQIGLSTDIGPVKAENEDVFVWRLYEDDHMRQVLMVAVADGMGGSKNGAAASQYAKTSLEEWWDKRIKRFIRHDQPLHSIMSEVGPLLESIDAKLFERNTKSGTTLSVLFMYGGQYAVAHVGDSRIYQVTGSQSGLQNYFRQNQSLDLSQQHTESLETESDLIQLTEDHSWVEQQIKRGQLTREQARTHHKRNVLTQCLGIEKGVKLNEQLGVYQASDLFLLCSDGFYSLFTEEEILQTLRGLENEYTDLQAMSDYLVKLANYSGAYDNITVLLVRHIHVDSGPRVEGRSLASWLPPFLKRKKAR
ncbi:PP2C family protein-serine/threonine phosphatase [Alkalicoccobacillus gibsonii]|uniref:PP2C family protein-serine/threonine phosphatase n=1 Tax=Alkalicoccobacillus gibsonii TaxID=79881 RepID=UPI001932F6A3|nr:protein phosphatase 2C domain-containing protein [Alkalicoccobacillus gibsonii]MBM0066650.1 serine/threonine-protein phosphatase [Alkalicoccobacillus gibsonii]